MPIPVFLRLVWPASKGGIVAATALVTAIALGAVWGSTFYWLTLNRGERIDATKETLSHLSETIDEHVDGQLRGASVILRTVETWASFHPTSDLQRDPEFAALAQSTGAGRPGFAGIRLVLADGASVRPIDNVGRLPIAYVDAPFVQTALALAPGQIYLGEAFNPPNTNRWLLPMALRLPPRSDGVALLATAIDLDVLAQAFDRARPTAAGAVTILRSDRKMILRVPNDPSRSSATFGRGHLFSVELPEAPSGVYENPSSAYDGSTRLVSYRTLPDFPIIVSVSAGETEILSGWRRELIFSLVFSGLVSVSFIASAWWLMRLLNEGQGQAIELAESRRVLIKAQTLAQLGSFRRLFATQEMVWSVEACRILGYPPGMAPNSVERFLALVHPDDLGLIGDTLRTTQEGRSYAFDFRIVDAHGEVRHLHAMGTPEFDDAGTPVAADGIIQDITERKQMEQALRDARDAAERGSRAKSEFLANMSHELRTPLNAIIGFSEIMREEILGPVGVPKYQEYLGDINNSAQHLLLIINDILDIARIEAGRIELKEARIDLKRMIEECARMLRGRVADAGLKLETRFDDGASWCIGDERLLRQALLNLTSNAVKFTPSGGRVSILVGRKAGGELTLAVQDTGIGMSADEAAVALRPFGQVQSAFARTRDGVGLGLPLAKSFVELHGGELVIESVPGHGTTVLVKLPSWRVAQALG
ncbi:MAG TPA: ATP-binding protein [Aliidongia sp.]|uniref:sensor histidine kinase n=1 Tax=Aliidongia sp. TaxID=1914230 RepID=UPI002DDDB9B9|nr:ATP-binding protein [Aliidongia sp.]HEV2678653.1 ATP-binding protein [Aliidongia sp.]